MKKAIKLILMFGVLGSFLLLHYKSNYAEENNDSLKDKLLLNYRAYSLSSFNASKDKMVHYAEDLYQKDLAENETNKEFKGFTVIEYCWKALDEYKDELNVQKELSLFLPLIAVILIILAVITSIRLGLSAIRKLDFDNEATSF